MPKTTVYISLAVGPQLPASPAWVVFRSPFRLISGSVTTLPEPAPVALSSNGTATVEVDPGVWLVDEVLPTQVIRRAVAVPASNGVVQYSSLQEVTSPAEIGFGPTWAQTALEAAGQSEASALAASKHADDADTALAQVRAVVAKIPTESDALALALTGAGPARNALIDAVSTEITPKLAPLQASVVTLDTDTRAARAHRLLSAASAYEIDFRTGAYTYGGIGVTRYQATLSGVLLREGSFAVVAPQALTNLMPNLPIAGAAVGITDGPGGALPTGWQNNFSAVPKEVLAFDSEGITLKMGPQNSGSFGGVRLPAVSPSGPVCFSLDLTPGALPPMSEVPAYLSVGWFKDGTLTSVNARTFWTGDSPRRVSLQLPQPAADSRLALSFSAGLGAPQQSVIVGMSRLRLDLVSKVGTSALGQPPYAAGTTPASTTVLNIDNGSYILVALTDAGEYVRRRVTAANGEGLDLATAMGGWFRLARLWLVPVAQYTIAMADRLLELADPDWRSPAVRIAGNESSAPMVMRAFDRVQNAIEDIGAASADIAARRSILLSQKVPGVMNFNVAPGDKTAADSANQERAEIHIPEKMPYDQFVWCSFWVRINSYPADFSTDCSTSIMQARYTNDPGDTTTKSPDLSLRVYPKPPSGFNFTPPAGHVGVAMITNSTQSSPPTNDNALVVRKMTALKIGAWTHFTIRAQFSRTGGGYLQYWQDSVSQFDGAVALGHNRILGPQFRFGAYSNHHEMATRDITIRDVEYGLSSLSSRVAAIAPL